MEKKLLDLTIDEVSLVDKGANPGAKVVVFKRDSDAGQLLVSKCLDAMAKEDVSKCSVEDFEGALHSLAQDHADRTGEGYHTAYAKVLHTPEGVQLYTGMLAAKRF